MLYPLTGRISNARPYSLDKTLLVDGAGADAKAVGDAIEKLKDEDIANVQKSADNAKTAADEAQASADNAQTSADNAQTSADEAKELANNAQSSADNAQTSADTAKVLAGQAQETADNALPKAGGVMEGEISMGLNKIASLADPENEDDAVNLRFMESYAKTLHQLHSINISETDWEGEATPYKYQWDNTSIKASDYPHVCASIESQEDKAAWNCVSYAVAEDGYIRFFCLEEKPKKELTLWIEVNR